jgi:tetratricopeptide (TPR) repeat protein
MTPERWRRIAELYHAAVAREPCGRGAFLQTACAGDEALQHEVESLLAHQQSAGSFLEKPLLSAGMAALAIGSTRTLPTGSPDSESANLGSTDTLFPFVPGELIEGRFRIVREIAQGGMAVVYEAIDEKLEQRIAIKRAKPGFSRRLPPEVRSALQVTHPNVCRTYEIHQARTPHGDLDFLTMEFLEGETLSERIGRDGPLDERTARDVALQICAGLEEAHRKNVVHRDLKSQNVILTKTSSGQLRVVISDFGLARQTPTAEASVASAAASATGLGGTPAYMAPELWTGAPASVASDIYALGVILHEIVAGHRPIGDDVPNNGDRHERLRPLIPHVASSSAAWDREILRCLEPDPARRFRSVLDLRRALQRARSRQWTWLASILVLTLSANGGLSYDQAWRSNVPAARLAVGEFDVDPELRVLAGGVLQKVSERLGRLPATARLRILPASQALSQPLRTPAQARTTLGATHLLYGAIQKAGHKIAATATVADTSTQLTLRTLAAEYEVTELGNLPRALAGTVTAALRIPGVAPESVAAPAYPSYVQAINYLRSDDINVDSAMHLFENATQLDPNSALPYAGLVTSQLREFQLTKEPFWKDRAKNSMDKARARNPDSGPVHVAAGFLEHIDGRYERAVEEFQRALELEPKNADAHRRLAHVYESMNRLDEAQVAYQRAISAEPGYYKAYIDLGFFHYKQVNYEEAAVAFRKATELAPDVALGHTNLGGTLANLARYDESEAEYRVALRLRESHEAFENLANILAFERRDAEAIEFYKRALTFPPPRFGLWMNIGDSYRRVGHSNEAADAYRQGEALAEHELRLEPRDGYARAFAAYFYGRLGDRKRALLEIDQALRLSPGDTRVLRRAVLLYDALGQRDDVFRLLSAAPATLLAELGRLPDLVDLNRDPRFQELRTKAGSGRQ